MTHIKIPLEDIIDKWLEEQGIVILWDDEEIVDQGLMRGPSLILHVKNTDQVYILNKTFYGSVQDFLETYEVDLG